MNLKNKKILITGATGGIGNCLVKKFNDYGSKIIATGITKSFKKYHDTNRVTIPEKYETNKLILSPKLVSKALLQLYPYL